MLLKVRGGAWHSLWRMRACACCPALQPPVHAAATCAQYVAADALPPTHPPAPMQALSLAESGALPGLFSAGALQQFSPAFIADHAVAM